MTEFESRIDDSSESDQRSRSDRAVSHARQVRVGTPSEPTISESMSTPDERRPVPNQMQISTNTNQSPDATPLSQFLQSNEHSPQLPRNPFQSPPGQGVGAEGPPGHSFSQTNVRNELHLSMDPFIIAQASQMVEQANSALAQSRDELRHEAIQYVERVQGETRAEAIQVLNQVQTEANRAIDDSHTQVAQSQTELIATRVEATEALNRASLELESIRNQCRFEVESLKAQAKAEYMSLKAEAQKQVSILEGKVGELIHVNSQLQDRLIAQTKESERLLKLLTEKEGAYESLLHQIQNQEIDEKEPLPVRPTSEEAGNGAGFFQIFIPVGRHSQPGPGSRGFMLDADQSHAQDAKAGVKPSSSSQPDVKPPGSIQQLGKFQKGYNSNEQVPKSKGEKGSKSSQQYDAIMNQLSTLVPGRANQVSIKISIT